MFAEVLMTSREDFLLLQAFPFPDLYLLYASAIRE